MNNFQEICCQIDMPNVMKKSDKKLFDSSNAFQIQVYIIFPQFTKGKLSTFLVYRAANKHVILHFINKLE